MNAKRQPTVLSLLIALLFVPTAFAVDVHTQNELQTAINANTTTDIEIKNSILFDNLYDPAVDNGIGNLTLTNNSNLTLTGSYQPQHTGQQDNQFLNTEAATALVFTNAGSQLTITGFGVQGSSAQASTAGVTAGTGEDKSHGEINVFQGRGGAIYAGDTLSFSNGSYAFTNNQATGGNAIANSSYAQASGALAYADASAYISGLGGAIYATNTLSFSAGNYTFANNQATGGDAIANSSYAQASFAATLAFAGAGASAATSGLGGAIYAADTLSFSAGNYTFANNQATGGDAIANSSYAQASGNNTNSSASAYASISGLGGAIYAVDTLNFTDGSYTFANNQATGGDAYADARGATQTGGGGGVPKPYQGPLLPGKAGRFTPVTS